MSVASAYDPLKVPDVKTASRTFDVTCAGRTLPLGIYLPVSELPAPVILFSHGLGGSRDNNPYLGNHWAKRGYAVVFIQHPGSDDKVWKDASRFQRMGAMKEAASGKNRIHRVKDIPAVIDALTDWNATVGNPLKGRLNLKRIGMSGHSFGAVTTQALAGQALAGGRASFPESRLSAAVMFSPGPPKVGDPATAFGPVKIPCLLMTGTHDDSPIGETTPADRLQVFPHLSRAPAWQVVFDQANYMSFGEREKAQGGSRYHRAILALTTAFWDAQLRGNKEAAAWLNSPAARSVLVPADRWEMNRRAKDGR